MFGLTAYSQNTSITDIDQKVEELLKKMTLEEKIGQLNQVAGDFSTGTNTNAANEDLSNGIKAGRIGSILSHTNFENKRKMQGIAVTESRLKIPLIFGFDVIHGYKTIFPIPLAQSSTWDMKAIEQVERIAATEAAADGQNWTFAPMVDVSNDPRWGRVMEGAGEDAYLGSLIAKARVIGFQGTDLNANNTVLACAKHFAGYGAAIGGRDYNSVEMSETKLRNWVLPPFKACLDAGVGTYMNAFHTLNGVPCTMNPLLVNQILRKEWGFTGFVVSDWDSVGELVEHGVATNDEEAAWKALIAGCDMDMSGGIYINHLKTVLEKDKVTLRQIDDAVRRVLKMKFALGLFDDPFKYLNKERREATLEKPEYLEAARDVARKGMVLLKNDKDVLPLNKNQKIAMVGPYANSIGNKDYMSFWTLGIGFRQYDSTKVVTPLQGLQRKLGKDATILTANGSVNKVCTPESIAEAVRVASQADVIVVCVGEQGYDCGESRSVADLNLNGNQEELIKALHKLGKPIIMVLFNSRPLTFEWASENVPSILVAWQSGYQTGNALADVLMGDYNPAGKLTVTFPRSVGQVPLFYNRLETGRYQYEFGTIWKTGYLDIPNTPKYPFGYGLSYTTFEYGDMKLNSNSISSKETLEVSITIKNTGKRVGEEVVQLYVRDMVGDIARPVKELKGFEKVVLKAGESKEVKFKITAEDLAYWNAQMQYKADPGEFKVMVGPNSDKVQETMFTLK
jgi:beta-glucosidase